MTQLRPLILPLAALAALGGCESVVLAPSGDIAAQQRDLLVTSTLLMLIIIIPVMALTAFFAWKYRASRKDTYDPDWHHSTHLELVIWAAPLAIIICLGALTWVGTHLLDPYRPLDRVAEDKPITAEMVPLEVEVVSLDWKWLFIYPQYGVATVNELAAPVDRPIRFKLTSETVMNAFYVPALAGMIYSMPGMTTQLHAVINYPGTYDGFSANYSGAGFSNMRFKFHGLDEAGFEDWIAKVGAASETLDRPTYLALAVPSEKDAPRYFSAIDPEIFRRATNRCVQIDRMCVDEMMAIDAQGGAGFTGTHNTFAAPDRRAAVFGPERFHVATFCTEFDSRRLYGPGVLMTADGNQPLLPPVPGRVSRATAPRNL